MVYRTVLYCTLLYCTVFHSVLYCTVLYCNKMQWTVLYCTVLYYHAVSCHVMSCHVIACHFISFHFIEFHGMESNGIECTMVMCCHELDGASERTRPPIPTRDTRRKLLSRFEPSICILARHNSQRPIVPHLARERAPAARHDVMRRKPAREELGGVISHHHRAARRAARAEQHTRAKKSSPSCGATISIVRSHQPTSSLRVPHRVFRRRAWNRRVKPPAAGSARGAARRLEGGDAYRGDITDDVIARGSEARLRLKAQEMPRGDWKEVMHRSDITNDITRGSEARLRREVREVPRGGEQRARGEQRERAVLEVPLVVVLLVGGVM